MSKVHDFGKEGRFFQFIHYPVKGWYERGWTQEIEPPYRFADSRVFKFFYHRAIVFGKWGPKTDNVLIPITSYPGGINDWGDEIDTTVTRSYLPKTEMDQKAQDYLNELHAKWSKHVQEEDTDPTDED